MEAAVAEWRGGHKGLARQDWRVDGGARFLVLSVEALAPTERKSLIEVQPDLSVMRRCELLKVPRSSAYYKPAAGVRDDDLVVMRLMDEIRVRHPFKGSRRITWDLEMRHGYRVTASACGA